MAGKYPYTSGNRGLVQLISHLRKTFPANVSAETLKKLGFAPNNEAYVITTLRFVNVLDEEGKQTEEAAKVFTQHDDAAFGKGFSEMIKLAYEELFSLHKDQAWSLPSDKLIQFFRTTDRTSAVIGQRQAKTFQALAGLAGHGDVPVEKMVSAPRAGDKKVGERKPVKKVGDPKIQRTGDGQDSTPPRNRDLGLSVRLEINLPPAGDQETYDRIFKSIRTNLLNGE